MSQNPFSMLTLDTPLKPLIVCASGSDVQLHVALCVYSVLRSPLHLLMECCFEMLTYKHNRKCKKKLKNTHANPYDLYLYIHMSVQVYLNKN